MTTELYRYRFSTSVPAEDITATLLLAEWGVASLHGEAQAQLDAGHHFDPARRSLVIDAGTAVGRDFNRLFLGYLSREFGLSEFHVEHVTDAELVEQQHFFVSR